MPANRQNLETLRGIIAGEPGTAPTFVLKRLREARGLKQADVAQAAGISSAMLSAVEGGTRELTPAVALKAAGSLGVDVNSLQTAHMLDAMKREAESGTLDPEVVREAANGVALKMEDQGYGDSEDTRQYIEAMADIHQAATKAFQGSGEMLDRDEFGKRRRGGNDTRSSGYGRRAQQSAPLDPTGDQHHHYRDGVDNPGNSREPIERDSSGKRVNKRFGNRR